MPSQRRRGVSRFRRPPWTAGRKMILVNHLQVRLLLKLEPDPELAEASPKSLRDRVLLLQLLNVETNRKKKPREGKETLEAEPEPEMDRDWQCQ